MVRIIVCCHSFNCTINFVSMVRDYRFAANLTVQNIADMHTAFATCDCRTGTISLIRLCMLVSGVWYCAPTAGQLVWTGRLRIHAYGCIYWNLLGFLLCEILLFTCSACHQTSNWRLLTFQHRQRPLSIHRTDTFSVSRGLTVAHRWATSCDGNVQLHASQQFALYYSAIMHFSAAIFTMWRWHTQWKRWSSCRRTGK